MAILSPNYHTLASYKTRENPDGTVATVAEILNQMRPVTGDIPFTTCNDGSLNITYQRTELPTVTIGNVQGGFTPSRSEVAQISDHTAQIRALSVVSKDVVDLNGNGPQQRALEARAFIEALGQKAEDLIFNGSLATDNKTFDGLGARYSSTTAGNGENVLLGGSVTASVNASIYFVVWGDQNVHGIVPQGTQMGIKHEMANNGNYVTRTLSNGNVVQEYQDFWSWHMGIAIPHWGSVCRIGNINVNNLTSESGAADLLTLMIKAWYRIERRLPVGTPAIYMPRTVAEMMDVQARKNVMTGGQLSYSEIDGKPMTRFRGIPIKVSDKLSVTEALIS